MRQVVVIHGGDSFATYEEYLAFLADFELELTRTGKGWKSTLAETLGENYEILAPSMPNKQNAKYAEWKLWFQKYLPYMQDEVLLVGHSLGGSFLAKYLAEERLPKRIRATFLIAAPYDTDGERTLVEFNPKESLDLLREQGGSIFLYHSTDDPIVAITELAKYVERLPGATVRRFSDRGHFIQDTFPELIQDLQSVG